MNNEPSTQLEAATMLTQEITELGPHAHEKEIFDAVYHFLAYYDAQFDTLGEELDEETEYELTPAGEFAADIAAEFSPFSPSVGTFEGTDALAELVGAYKNVIQRAPVGEREWGTTTPPIYDRGPFNAAQTIAEAFTPCGAD